MSKIDEVLAGVTSLGFDTAPLIYFVECHPAYVDIVREFVRHVDIGTILGYSSMVTLTEVLTQPKQKGNTTLEQEYRDLLLHVVRGLPLVYRRIRYEGLAGGEGAIRTTRN